MKTFARNLSFVFASILVLGCGGGAGHPGGGGGGVKLDGGTGDMAMASVPDLTMGNTKPDLSMGAMGSATCGATVQCLNGCMDSNCQKACLAAATKRAQMLLFNLLNCLFGNQMQGIAGACPDFNSGVCDSMGAQYVQANCDACLMKAQGMGGACSSQLMACSNDM